MDETEQRLRANPQFAAGAGEAEADVARGELAYYLCGKVVFSVTDQAAVILKERYAIDLRVDGHCIVPHELAAWTMSYNERMAREFIVRFGKDVIAAVSREVERKQKKRG